MPWWPPTRPPPSAGHCWTGDLRPPHGERARGRDPCSTGGGSALLTWAHVHSLVTFYAAFVLAGLAMAATLYEPAFAVTAAWFIR
ncbi:MAG: hypothetical protein J2P20_10400, partial [Pseudonocardia sp.]|nr:hypothetical protein [Pseudonocardia sp.]